MTEDRGSTLLSSFKWLAEVAVGLTLISTVVSLVVNMFLFDSWGIPFSTVATPSDLIVGGAEGFKIFTPFVLDLYFAKDLAKLWRKISLTALRANGVSLVLMVLIGFNLAVSINPVIADKLNIDNQSIIWYLIFHVIVIIISSLFIFRWRIREEGVDQKLLIEIIISAFIAVALFQVINEARNRDLHLVVITGSKHCVGNEYIVWSGSYSVITSCATKPYSPTSDFYILKREDLEFRKIPNMVGTTNAQTH